MIALAGDGDFAFASGVSIWRRNLGTVREAVELVGRQLEEHLPAAATSRERADLLALGSELAGSFDVVCCHGVLMYLQSLDEALAALIATTPARGIVSVLTRNRASLAMRAGKSGDWQATLGEVGADQGFSRSQRRAG